jgi:hypothetical protein
MIWLDTFLGVLSAQLVIWLVQFLIKKTIEPVVERGHKKFSRKVKRGVVAFLLEIEEHFKKFETLYILFLFFLLGLWVILK